jgi:hypothetical protein
MLSKKWKKPVASAGFFICDLFCEFEWNHFENLDLKNFHFVMRRNNQSQLRLRTAATVPGPGV